jgi:AraC-like DNA-binding protein
VKLTTVTELELERVQKAACLLQEHIKHPLTIAQLAAKVKLSVPKLKQVFKQVYGMGPYTYVIHIRMEKAKSLLLQGQPIKAIVSTIGYQSESNFCKAFRKSFNETPMVWMKNELIKTG